jgi:hypothetical protein
LKELEKKNMKKITWTWKKIVALVGTLFGIGMLVSCYGMVVPPDEDFEKYLTEQTEENENKNDSEIIQEVPEN